MNSLLERDTMFVVTYAGPFGYIKPWTAVRDLITYSQTFLTPSIVEGMRQKLEVSAILRHSLRHAGIDEQQERTQSSGWTVGKTQMSRKQSIIQRGVLIHPTLTLAFPTQDDAEKASSQHLCLCRNEDVLLPLETVEEISEGDFNALPGIELMFGESTDSFLVGFNRFVNAEPMYGSLRIVDGGE